MSISLAGNEGILERCRHHEAYDSIPVDCCSLQVREERWEPTATIDSKRCIHRTLCTTLYVRAFCVRDALVTLGSLEWSKVYRGESK
jgi:hypothetical protein